jgi:predicted nucleic acid-binding protein
VTLYLDTSSLVKLYVAEPGADAVRELVDRATIVATSVIAYAETRSALARLRREGSLSPAAFASIKQSLDEDWPSYLTLDVTTSISRAAGDLAERYCLRGYDSVHLASFMEVARRAGAGETRFSSFDERLNRAAQAVARSLARTR